MFTCACCHFICRIDFFHLCSCESSAQWHSVICVFVCECVFVSGVLINFCYGIYGFGIIYIPVISYIRLMILLHRLVVC